MKTKREVRTISNSTPSAEECDGHVLLMRIREPLNDETQGGRNIERGTDAYIVVNEVLTPK